MASTFAASGCETLKPFIDTLELEEPLPRDSWNGKRSAARRMLVIPAHVRKISDPPDDAGEPCKLRDITHWGIGIRSRAPYPIGQQVRVDLCVNNTAWGGEMKVVHCTQTIGGYKVGLVLAEFADGRRDPASEAAQASAVPADPTPHLRKVAHEREWLAKAKAEVKETMRAYLLARRTWGLLGVSVRRQIHKLVSGLPAPVNVCDDARRRHPRARTDTDIQMVALIDDTWRRVSTRMTDVSEDGVGLIVPRHLIDDSIGQELTGDVTAHPGMAVILGLGNEPERLWVPAEIIRCQKAAENTVRVGARFVTPKSLRVFGK